MRALIVEDSTVMRKVVERALGQAGFLFTEVLHAANGIEALEVLRRDEGNAPPLRLILSDINMPEMNGVQFLESRRTENLAMGVPAVMISAEGTQSMVLSAIAAGAQGYICKPFTAEQLRLRISPLLRQSELLENI